VARGDIPGAVQVVCVRGRYRPPTPARSGILAGVLAAVRAFADVPDWAACVLGPAETDCLVAAAAGGKARIGFKNTFIGPDGRPRRLSPEWMTRLEPLCVESIKPADKA